MLWRKATKYGLNVRSKGGHVGHHHHHIGGLPTGVIVKPVPQSVVQYFNFALRRMRLHHLNTAIVCHRLRRVGHRIQVQNVGLNFLKSGGLRVLSLFGRVNKEALLAHQAQGIFGLIKPLQCVQIIAALLTP